MVVLLFTHTHRHTKKKKRLKRKKKNVGSVECKIKHTNKGLGECMAQKLTSPLHGWGCNVPVTGGWSDHDNRCTIDRHVLPEMNKTYKESLKFSCRFSAMIRTDKA